LGAEQETQKSTKEIEEDKWKKIREKVTSIFIYFDNH